MDISSNTPLHLRPEFWRERAEEWRGPWSLLTRSGICMQLDQILPRDSVDEAKHFLYRYQPETARLLKTGLYFFPKEDRESRAKLCDKIADDLEIITPETTNEEEHS